MSGGSLDYVCYKIDDAIDTIEREQQQHYKKHLQNI